MSISTFISRSDAFPFLTVRIHNQSGQPTPFQHRLETVTLTPITFRKGIAPTLLYPVPSQSKDPFLAMIIKSLRDYYPLWQLIYQTFVFLSRSSISLGIKPLPRRLLPVPALAQGFILMFLALESALGILPGDEYHAPAAIVIVAFFVAMEGLCGGLA